jgi:hypothetical protein
MDLITRKERPMASYLKIGEYIINPQLITSVRQRQSEEGEEGDQSRVTIYFSGDTHPVNLKGNEARAFLLWVGSDADDITPVAPHD